MTGAVTNHLQKNHKPEWDAYCETRTRANAKKAEVKEEEKLATPSLEEDEESWAMMAKGRKVERQKEVNYIVSMSLYLKM